MVCIYCGHETEVYNSRERARNPSVWRRRRCSLCVAQFTTEELPDYRTSLVVKGQDHKLYPFNRDKLFLSLHSALGHRQDALTPATELTSTVIGSLLRKKRAPDGLLTISVLAKQTHQTLKRFDPLAAHTYKAYHQTALKSRGNQTLETRN